MYYYAEGRKSIEKLKNRKHLKYTILINKKSIPQPSNEKRKTSCIKYSVTLNELRFLSARISVAGQRS